jgi:nitrite reductase/ring-hydroxylating ferredoxin subunit
MILTGPSHKFSQVATSVQYYDVCSIDEIPAGEARMFVIEEIAIGLFHIEQQFYAMENGCPHAGASLAHGEIDGCTVACRIHHWKFDIPTGRYLDESKPCYDVRTLPVRVVGTRLEVGLES